MRLTAVYKLMVIQEVIVKYTQTLAAVNALKSEAVWLRLMWSQVKFCAPTYGQITLIIFIKWL